MNPSTRTQLGGARILLVIVACLFLLLLLPRMIAADIFLDGLTYASMARNMAEGRGTFWKPHYTETVYPEFYESPPLGIWLQSLAFRVFGDSTLVEFLWGVGCGAIVLWLLLLAWRDLRAGPAVALGMLTKGLPAAFPLAVPAAAAVFLRSGATRAARTTVIMLLAGGAVLAAFMAVGGSDAWRWADRYLSDQVMRSLMGQREVSTSRLSLVPKLVNQLAVPTVLVLLSLVLFRRGHRAGEAPLSAERRQVAFLLTSALLAPLPLLVSPKQSAGYLFPSLPLWAMTLAAAFPAGAARVESRLDAGPRWGARLRSLSPAALATDWYAVAYTQRFFKVSLTAESGRPLRFVDLSAEPRPAPPCRMLNQHPPRRYWVGDCSGGF